MVMTHLHLVALPREGRAAQPVGGASKSASAPSIARTASRWRRSPSCRSASGRAVRQRLERASSTRVLGGWQFSGEVRVADRPAAHVQQQHLLRSGVRRSERSEVQLGQRQRRSEAAASTCRSSTLAASTRSTASRSATPPGQPVTFTAPRDRARRGEHPPFPTTLPNVRFHEPSPARSRPDQELPGRQPGPRAGAHRGAERHQLHAVQRRQRDARRRPTRRSDASPTSTRAR